MLAGVLAEHARERGRSGSATSVCQRSTWAQSVWECLNPVASPSTGSNSQYRNVLK
jgi:hypothetical protein